jgi:hypothetical protein
MYPRAGRGLCRSATDPAATHTDTDSRRRRRRRWWRWWWWYV